MKKEKVAKTLLGDISKILCSRYRVWKHLEVPSPVLQDFGDKILDFSGFRIPNPASFTFERKFGEIFKI